MRGDLSVIGLQSEVSRRIAASATRYEVGEPLHGLGALTNGAINTNTYVLAAADTPVIGTHKFGGVAIRRCRPLESGTVVAHRTVAACPVAYIGMVRGKAMTAGSVDTESEVIGVIGDSTLIDYNATGASDGGELYTIIETATADTSGLEIVDGNPAKGTLDVVVCAQAYRHDVS